MNDLPKDAQILAAKLADARGVSAEEAVTLALRESLARTMTGARDDERLTGDDLIRRLEEISMRASSLPLLDPRSPDEILGYDEFGLPGWS